MKSSDLYKIDMFGFNSKIGYITNIGTTFYAMQALYEVNSPEYDELDNRLKLLCCAQNREIDHSKGIITKDLPKHWTQYQKIEESDSEEEKARKEFENKLVIKKRPEFMKFLYSRYMKEYKDFVDDFDRYSYFVFGKNISELSEDEKNSDKGKALFEYYDKKNPLLESDSVMNKLCRYMQKEVKEVKKTSKQCDTEKIYNILYNTKILFDENLCALMVEKYHEYHEFKKSKQLKVSDYNTYEQYFKSLRNECLEKISSNLQELANLAVYVCYKMFPKKPKDFCWDVFGRGIVENLQETREYANIPQLSENGDIEYLGEVYKMSKVNVKKIRNNYKTNKNEREIKSTREFNDSDFDDLMVDIAEIDEFDWEK